MTQERRRSDDWQNKTDLRLNCIETDIGAVKADVQSLKSGQDVIAKKLDENTRVTTEAVKFVENLAALNKLASGAGAVVKYAAPAVFVWGLIRGFLFK